MFEELSLHILDIAMNSLAAAARTVQITIIEHARRDSLLIRIRDDGCGMDEPTLQQVLATSTTTKVSRRKGLGLGLAFLRQTAEMCGGKFRVRSRPGAGTTVTARMKLSHVDRPPLGGLECDDPGLVRRQPGGGRAARVLERRGAIPFQLPRTGRKKRLKPPQTLLERRKENEL